MTEYALCRLEIYKIWFLYLLDFESAKKLQIDKCKEEQLDFNDAELKCGCWAGCAVRVFERFERSQLAIRKVIIWRGVRRLPSLTKHAMNYSWSDVRKRTPACVKAQKNAISAGAPHTYEIVYCCISQNYFDP